MTKKDYENPEKSTEDWIYKKWLKEGGVKVKYYDHITGKCHGLVRQDSTVTKKNPCCVSKFSNLWFTSFVSRS